MNPLTPAKLDLDICRGIGFGPVEFQFLEEDGTPFDLTGWTAAALARKQPTGASVINLAPVVTDAVEGRVDIPEMLPAATLAFAVANLRWDLVLIDPDGQRHGPFHAGTLAVKSPSTRTAL